MVTPDPERLQSYEERISALNTQMQKWNAVAAAFAQTMDGQFRDAGESIVELHNPIYKLNSAVITAQGNMKQLGVDMEQAMVNASMRATMLVQRMEMLKARTMSLPRAFMSKINDGARVESERIAAAAGIMRSEYAKSIPEAQRILSEVRKTVVKESAPLPGDTFTHLEVLGQTIDDAMKMAKDAGKTMEEAQKFSATVAGQIGAIGGTAGADQYSIIRFANALMSGSLSPRSRLDLVERNPAVKNAMKEVFKARGVRTLEQVSKPKRMEAIAELLEKAMPASQLEAASASFQGAIEGFNTSFKSLFNFNRTLTDTFERYKGPDVTVFDELKEVVISLVNPLKDILDAIIQNPITDPMNYLARSIGLLNGFFGNTTIDQRQLRGMSITEANQNLGFVDFIKFMGVNAGELVERTTQREKNFLGADTTNFLKGAIGKDIPSILINSLTSKFRAGIDGVFAQLTQFVSMGKFINDLDIGGSIGVVMAEVTNNVIYMFNNLLPIIIEQTASLFRHFKEQINIVDLLTFLKLFGGFKNMWDALQAKISRIAEDAPKYFNKVTAGVGVFLTVFGTAGTVVGLFGRSLVKALAMIETAVLRLVGAIAKSTGTLHQMPTFVRKQQASDAVRQRREMLMNMDPAARQAWLNANRRNSANTRDVSFGGANNDMRSRRGISGPFDTFVGRHERHSRTIQRFSLNPMSLLFNMGQASQGNNLQNFAGMMGRMTMPLMMASQMGVVPGGLAQTAMFTGLGAGVLGNVTAGVGRLFGANPERQQRRREVIQRMRGRGFGNIGQGIMSGDRNRLAYGGRQLMVTNFMGMKTIMNFLSKIPGLAGILAKVAPILTAVAANFWMIAGTFMLVIGIVKRAYAASPALRRAVARFMTGLRNMFASISRFITPLYKTYIAPLFKILGDLLAKIFNAAMNLMNMIPGIDFGEEDKTSSVSLEAAEQVAKDRRDERTKTERRQIEAGRKEAFDVRFYGNLPGITAINAASGYMPKMSVPAPIMSIPAAAGFGQIDIPSLMNAATLEAKMMPANEKLILANTSETILTREQMAAGRVMSQSKHYNVPKIDIMINNSGNQSPEAIANEVATVMMNKLRDTENMS